VDWRLSERSFRGAVADDEEQPPAPRGDGDMGRDERRRQRERREQRRVPWRYGLLLWWCQRPDDFGAGRGGLWTVAGPGPRVGQVGPGTESISNGPDANGRERATTCFSHGSACQRPWLNASSQPA
jgi:hypothetical protein